MLDKTRSKLDFLDGKWLKAEITDLKLNQQYKGAKHKLYALISC